METHFLRHGEDLFLATLHHRLRSLRAIVSPACLFLVSGVCIASCAFAASPASGSKDGVPAFGTWLESDAAPNPAQQKDTTPQKPPPQKPQTAEPFRKLFRKRLKNRTPLRPLPLRPQAAIQEVKPAAIDENIVEEVQFRGQRKVPQDTLRGLIFTKKGDVYDEAGHPPRFHVALEFRPF